MTWFVYICVEYSSTCNYQYSLWLSFTRTRMIFFYLFFLVRTVPEMNIFLNISTSLTSSVHSQLASFLTHNSTSLKFPSVAAVRSFWKKITAFTFLTWTYEWIIIVKKNKLHIYSFNRLYQIKWLLRGSEIAVFSFKCLFRKTKDMYCVSVLIWP